jgi:hypothetical protein
MNIKGGQMITLNPIGSIIWQGLADGRSQEQIANGLASEFGVPVGQTLADVREFLEQLKEQQLIEPNESESPRKVVSHKPSGLFCNFFGKRPADSTRDPGSK